VHPWAAVTSGLMTETKLTHYKVNDKPYPRGEVLIGGDNGAKLPEVTADGVLEWIVLKELQSHGSKAKLQRFEIPD
jgi:hypothetical protein